MTTRDRLVLIAIVVLVVLAGGWLLAVSPERKQAAQARAQVQSARQQLESAQSQAATARAARQRYSAAYSSVVSLGKAVPPAEEVPSLLYELDQASDQRDVDFNSIVAGASSGTGSSSAASSSAPASAAATPAGFQQMPFTFIFKGSFKGLTHLLGAVDDFVQRTNAGQVLASGRLLTIQSANVALESSGGPTTGASGSSSSSSSSSLTATITATAYVLPASQGLTAGLTPIQSSSTGSSSASPTTTPAVVRVTP
jgi:hypothetical protein